MGTIRPLSLLLAILAVACEGTKTTNDSSDAGRVYERPAPFTLEVTVDQPFFGCRPIRFTVVPSNAVLPVSYTYSLNDVVIADVPAADLIPRETPAGGHSLKVTAVDGLNRLASATASFYLYEPYMCEPPPFECNTRCDCTEPGTICSAGRCIQATGPCLRDDQCPLGSICDFNRKCMSGCAEKCDCKGPEICNVRTLMCDVCSRANPCPAGEACSVDGVCEAATACQKSSDCSGGQVCWNGVCGFCGGHTDCSTDGSRRCAANGFCAETNCNDMDCQTALQDARAFCNLDTNFCDIPPCIDNDDCRTGEVCDAQLHQCMTLSCSEDCNGRNCESLGGFCDTTTCVCLVP